MTILQPANMLKAGEEKATQLIFLNSDARGEGDRLVSEWQKRVASPFLPHGEPRRGEHRKSAPDPFCVPNAEEVAGSGDRPQRATAHGERGANQLRKRWPGRETGHSARRETGHSARTGRGAPSSCGRGGRVGR